MRIYSFYLTVHFEAGVVRLGDLTLEMEKKQFYVNGEIKTYDELPFTLGDYTIYQFLNTPKKQVYIADLDGLEIKFSFYKNMLSLTTDGHKYLEDAVGILGQYPTGKMIGRDGQEMSTFEELAFEWQVQPAVDVKLFHNDRSPQLPYEKCRMPTAPRPSRKLLRTDRDLFQKALEACASKKHNDNDFELCIGDVVATGDVGMAEAW